MNAILKQALKMFGTENIANQAGQFLQNIVEQKKEIALQPGESEVAAMFYEQNNIVYFITAVFDDKQKIVRYIGEPVEVKQFIQQLLNKL